MKRILVCGGRDYGRVIPGKTFEYPRRIAEKKRLAEVLGKLFVEFGPFVLIHGGARGTDELAGNWAEAQRGFPKPLVFPANWDDVDRPGAVIKVHKSGPKKGKAFDVLAGHFRNQKMVDDGKPDLVVAFPGGSGTKDMVDRAKAAKIEIREVK